MSDVKDDVIGTRAARIESRGEGMSRAMRWSFGIHVAAVVLLFVWPSAWLASKETPIIMTVSLGGSVGEKSTGMTAAPSRQVDEVAPPPKRQEVVRPAEQKAPVKAAETSRVIEAPPLLSSRPTPPATAPPSTGRTVQQGSARAETGATSNSQGLSFGGGGGGAAQDRDLAEMNFCCPQFLTATRDFILLRWQAVQPQRGVTIVKVTIARDGRVISKDLHQQSGSQLLDTASLAAIPDRFPTGLPAAYTKDQLTLFLKFPYEGK